ncbi:glutathione S-transferase family protein [Nannocystaceae bacterium ST9]
MPAITLYSHPLSGHAHRVRLMLALLGLEFDLVDVDLVHGAHKQPEFLRLNAFGQVPVLVHEGRVIADSNAILVYLAKTFGREWLPEDPAGAAAVQRWLSVAAGPIAFGPAMARLITVFGAPYESAPVLARAHAILRLIEGELGSRDFLAGESAGESAGELAGESAGERPTIADLACYAYVAHAPEGNVSLAEYPRVRAWLARIEALPGFVPMQASAVGLNEGG